MREGGREGERKQQLSCRSRPLIRKKVLFQQDLPVELLSCPREQQTAVAVKKEEKKGVRGGGLYIFTVLYLWIVSRRLNRTARACVERVREKGI